MGPWWVANGIAELIDDIEICSSQHLLKLLATSSDHVRGIVLEEHIRLKQRQRLRGISTTRQEVLSEGPAFGLAMPALPQCLAGLAWHRWRISFPLAQFLWGGKE